MNTDFYTLHKNIKVFLVLEICFTALILQIQHNIYPNEEKYILKDSN